MTARLAVSIRTVAPEIVSVEITQARASGEKLGAEKGINVPESVLRCPLSRRRTWKRSSLWLRTPTIVGYSFVRTEADVLELQSRLAELGADEKLGIILKIETREGFDQLPRLLLAAMRSRAVGVMIARGDLAVECGYQRLAEVQEEILWISRGGAYAGDLGDTGSRIAREEWHSVPFGNHGCGHGRARRMRHAQQRALYCDCGPHPGRHFKSHASASGKEALNAPEATSG